jgi:hypothetical protein
VADLDGGAPGGGGGGGRVAELGLLMVGLAKGIGGTRLARLLEVCGEVGE